MNWLDGFTQMAFVWSNVAFATAWQGMVIAVSGALLIPRIPRTTAAMRYAMWWMLLIASLVIPGWVAWPTAANPAEATRAHRQIVIEYKTGIDSVRSIAPLVEANPNRPVVRERPAAAKELTVPPVIVRTFAAIWLLICLVMLLRLVLGVSGVRAIRRRSSAAPEHLLKLARQVHSELVHVRLTNELAVPGVIGYLHPVVLLPDKLIRSLDEDALRHVLLHEFAHVKRRDAWAALLLRLVRAITFPLPAAFIIARKLEIDQELACDEWALQHNDVEATDYVDSLLRLGEAALGNAPVRMTLVPSATTQLRYRVQSLLKCDRRREGKRLWMHSVLFGGVLVGGLIPLSAGAPSFAFTSRSDKVLAAANARFIPVQPSIIRPGAVSSADSARSSPRSTKLSAAATRVAPATDSLKTLLDELVDKLASRNAGTRAEAAFALSDFRNNALSATPLLMAMLSDEERIARNSHRVSKAWNDSENGDFTSPAEEAQKALLYAGRGALPSVIAALAVFDGSAKRRAELIAGLLRNYD